MVIPSDPSDTLRLIAVRMQSVGALLLVMGLLSACRTPSTPPPPTPPPLPMPVPGVDPDRDPQPRTDPVQDMSRRAPEGLDGGGRGDPSR
jgi:hypothetical protein